jgi:hypothetical protein
MKLVSDDRVPSEEKAFFHLSNHFQLLTNLSNSLQMTFIGSNGVKMLREWSHMEGLVQTVILMCGMGLWYPILERKYKNDIS